MGSASRRLALAALLFYPSVLQAQFAVCNQTLTVLNIAIGRHVYEDFETSGWWTVGPNQCANVIRTQLANRYIYVFAQDVFGKVALSGPVPMCVGPGRFEITGESDCLLRGYVDAGFHEVDTLKSERWTLFIHQPL